MATLQNGEVVSEFTRGLITEDPLPGAGIESTNVPAEKDHRGLRELGYDLKDPLVE